MVTLSKEALFYVLSLKEVCLLGQWNSTESWVEFQVSAHLDSLTSHKAYRRDLSRAIFVSFKFQLIHGSSKNKIERKHMHTYTVVHAHIQNSHKHAGKWLLAGLYSNHNSFQVTTTSLQSAPSHWHTWLEFPTSCEKPIYATEIQISDSSSQTCPFHSFPPKAPYRSHTLNKTTHWIIFFFL